MAAYRADPTVESVQPNYIYHASQVPNDPLFSQQWGFSNTGQTILSAGGPDEPDDVHNPGLARSDMGLTAAWDHITDCSSVIVAVVDTGINYNHQDLAANMWDGGTSFPHHGYDVLDSTNDPMDLNGHGSHVAGTIGAVGNNQLGGTGICWKVKLMAVRALDASGAGTSVTVFEGINWAVAHGAKVINLSLGEPSYDSSLDGAIANAAAQGTIVVAAAGNDGTNNDSSPTYPCNFSEPNLICVAALDQSYALASFSNYGAGTVHIAAPGVNIASTWNGAKTSVTDNLNSGWTFSSSTASHWGYSTATFGNNTSYNLLSDPANYDRSAHTYANSTTDKAYRAFNLSGFDAALLNFAFILDLADSGDAVNVAAKSSGGDPFANNSVLDTLSGSTDGYGNFTSYDITSCRTTTCTVGFELSSNSSGNSYGVGVLLFSIDKVLLNATTYNILEGTSMATPHITGLVAMMMAFNPSYRYQDIINAIENGGTGLAALAGKTTTGKAANAMGALAYINEPTGVSAAKH